MRIAFLCLLAACFSACAKDASVESRAEPVLYGADNRKELFEATTTQQDASRNSVVTLIPTWLLNTSDPNRCTSSAGTLTYQRDLCSGQRFGDQPAPGVCSGTLIDDDLVLTAGHCVDRKDAGGVLRASLDECRENYFVFDFQYASAGTLATIQRAQDVYTCQEIVAYKDTSSLDYAIVRLDRRATTNGKRVAPVRTSHSSVGSGTSVFVAGFPGGVPLKIADNATVVNTRSSTLDYFEANLDTFGGNSGSGVFNSSGTVIGILVRGQTDYTMSSEGGHACNRVNMLASNPGYGEDITYVFRAIEAMCSTAGVHNARLCGDTDRCGDGSCTGSETATSCEADCFVHRCGDGICGGGETSTTCSSDCITYRCGDGVCNGPETINNCAADCVTWVCGDHVCNINENATSCAIDCYVPPAPVVPSGWTCAQSFYDRNDGCHCNCGVYDPDCDSPGAAVNGCNANEICTSASTCLLIIDSRWTCDTAVYNAGDACDCNCGAYDPDCDDPNLALSGCVENATCSAAGVCVVGAPTLDGGAPSWSCDGSDYNDGTTCDCRCGIYDPDCADPSHPVTRCPDGYGCGDDTQCVLIEVNEYPDAGSGGTSRPDSGYHAGPRAASGGACSVRGANENSLWLFGLALWFSLRRRRNARIVN